MAGTLNHLRTVYLMQGIIPCSAVTAIKALAATTPHHYSDDQEIHTVVT